MTEKYIFNNILKPLEENYPVKFESIETGGHNPGFPDVTYFTTGSNGTLELKSMHNVVRTSTVTIRYEKGQYSKLLELRLVSKKVYLLLRVFEEYFLLDKIKKVYDNYDDLKESSCYNGSVLGKKFLETLKKP